MAQMKLQYSSSLIDIYHSPVLAKGEERGVGWMGTWG